MLNGLVTDFLGAARRGVPESDELRASLEESFSDIDDSCGIWTDPKICFWYKAALLGAADRYREWLLDLHTCLPTPGFIYHLGANRSWSARFPVWVDSEEYTELGWKIWFDRSSQEDGQAKEEDMTHIMFMTTPTDEDRFWLFMACIPSAHSFVLRYLELVFHSVFYWAADDKQRLRVSLWRGVIESFVLEALDARAGNGERPGHPLRPYQREAVEAWFKLVDEGRAPLQQFFARRYGVTDRTLRNWIAKHKREK